LNNQVPSIKFTVEEESEEGTLAFLDCLVTKNPNGEFSTSVFRKPTHTNRYLNFNSNHPVNVKRGLIRSLFIRAKNICSTEEILDKENEQLINALVSNEYPRSVIMDELNKVKKINTNTNRNYESENTIVLPYKNGTSEEIRRILSKYNIRTVFRPTSLLHNTLSKLKDPIPTERINNCVYRIPCGECSASYIGETSRELSTRLKEHEWQCRKKSLEQLTENNQNDCGVAIHNISTGHKIDFANTSVIAQGFSCYQERILCETFYINTNENSMNIQVPELPTGWS
jgi:hypothetical protein